MKMAKARLMRLHGEARERAHDLQKLSARVTSSGRTRDLVDLQRADEIDAHAGGDQPGRGAFRCEAADDRRPVSAPGPAHELEPCRRRRAHARKIPSTWRSLGQRRSAILSAPENAPSSWGSFVGLTSFASRTPLSG